ncbi:hypothetical protein [Inhella gelatinilytica]|uniref:Beta-lactamase family protein n=1 Tax=Inhella gelatinilytica TaxID=2795030 RepID=A0A931IZ39_9BURK|nr:hypothetical protein [Inhella gelatinilytica]MBH9552638.1 hypothetical protein [Inhella gelatinilytica]
MNAQELADGLRRAIQDLNFGAIGDPLAGGSPLRHFPSLDLAVVGFVPGQAPVAANVLFSRDQPEGLIATLPATFGPVQGVEFLADVQDAQGVSVAWLPASDWSTLPRHRLWGQGAAMRAPYPASLLKLMVAVGVAWACQQQRGDWDEAWSYQGQARALRDWQFDMLAVSCNHATSALVAWLHHAGMIRRSAGREVHNEVQALLDRLGLPTLRLHNTQPDGGWGNAAGAGVGQIHMTAWDTARLLWWLDPDAPPAPWLDAEAPRLHAEGRDAVLAGLREQGLDTILSSGTLAAVPGQPAGLPSELNRRWCQPDGNWVAGEHQWPAPSGPQSPTPSVRFAHKIGNTENYASDAGIVRSIQPLGRHYIVAFLSNLGTRYAHHPLACGPKQLAKLGAEVDRLMQRLHESRPGEARP